MMDSVPPPRFCLSLLGRFELTGPDGVVDLPNRKLAGLLAYLACTAPRPQPRERLSALLWGSHFDTQAKQNLRQALFRLRKVLGQDAFDRDGEVVSLNAATIPCDVSRFEALVREGSRDALSAAADLYRGPLIDDVAIGEEGWSEWLTGERQRLLELALGAMVRLGELELASDHARDALKAGQRAITLNNLREDAHRVIIRALAATGRRAEALKHYQNVVTLLKRELNVEPDAASKSLVASLRNTEPSSRSPISGEAGFPVPVAKAQLAPLLPDKPSIAVLPLTNIGGDSKEDYFSDGITGDIITELSRFSELFVIARNSSFQYKGKSPDIRQVGRELGVRYVLEGSIRRSGDRVRIAVQLIDAMTGSHRWAERYDRELRDVFALQDEVARTVVSILAAHVNKAEAERALLKPPASWQAYDYYIRAIDTYSKHLSSLDADALKDAQYLLERSLSIDPTYSRAYAALSRTLTMLWSNPLNRDHLSSAVLDRALQMASKGVQFDPNLPHAHSQLAMVLLRMNQLDSSIAEFERAVELNPNFLDWRFAIALIYAGRAERAITVLESHMRLDPFYAPMAPCWLGFAYFMLKRYSEAVSALRASLLRVPNFRAGHVWLAATYVRLGELDHAQFETRQIQRIDPNYTIQGTQKLVSHFKNAKDAEHLFDALRKAGLPEQ